MIQLRDYQESIARKAVDMIKQRGWCYLAMEVRTGKTLTSLSIADRLDKIDHVLFITKKKAISSITEDSEKLCPSYSLFIINYESLHKLPNVKWDCVIVDEAHSLGAYPKPSGRAKAVKQLLQKNDPYTILMSGTPTPESYSQMYHQVYGIPGNPFRRYGKFYDFARDYVKVKQRKINGNWHNNYDEGLESILVDCKPYMISFSQKDAGFKVNTQENVLYVDMSEQTYKLCKQLKADKVIEGREEIVLADTEVKLMQKLHQMFSGTVKFESGKSMVFDYTKAEFIHDNFSDKKIGIFYKFKEELNALKKVYGDDLTTELDEFNNSDKSIALQIVSGREGISLRKAVAIVYYNIDFSATSYWQSRDRMTTKDRLKNDVYWVFARDGIEKDIYNVVLKKKSYTINHFRNNG